ncbi:hypothetical protein D0C16_09705 [Cellvibrio sp. KY-GH-1]|uniref:carbohydrate-binding protein n=1 Tax=Cellvibrio sp. KY-GH-1 TaxID=2303332 RepID=UPI0012A0770B|nr:carbohydrate-binding protein [Cellvibrio sp. KY-GH-1]QEY16229.1 hypothetical protein D0C16_09705 [Cellvibrio sp. KY-GH-1]
MDRYLRVLSLLLISGLVSCGGGGGGKSAGGQPPSSLTPANSSSTASAISSTPSSLSSVTSSPESLSSIPNSSVAAGVLSSASSSVLSSSSVSDISSSNSSALAAREVIVQAEDYNRYFDSTPANEGGSYRTDAVDIEPVSDVGGGYNVGWGTPGEWLEYEVDLLPGTYTISTRVASAITGSYSLSMDGVTLVSNVGITTAGWHSWATQRPATVIISTAGVHTFRFAIASGGVNINWIKFTPNTGSSSSASSISNTVTLPYSKINPHLLFGFERTGLWTASNTSVQLSSNRTQGDYALSLTNITTTKITSAAINSFKNWGAQMGMDIYLENAAVGTLAIEASVPSRNIHNLRLSTIDLADIPLKKFTGITAAIPQALQDLEGEYTDLAFSLVISSASVISNLTLDNIRFVPAISPVQDKVEIEVKGNTDILYVIVNDVVREVWRSGQLRRSKLSPPVNGKLDISALFWKGANSVKVIGINGKNRNPIDVQLWVNGQSIFSKYCAEYDYEPQCLADNPEGIRHRYYLTVNTPNLPEPQKLEVAPTVDAQWGANLYINDMYIPGSMPATVFLPVGSYKVGLGKYRDEHLNYQGNFFEQDVDLRNGNALVNFAGLQPLGVQNTVKIAILPIKYALYSNTNLTGVLQQSELAGYLKQLEMTYNIWTKPFSYGLQQWDMSVLPMVENVTLRTNSNQDFSPEAFLSDAGLQQLRAQYQIIIFAFSVYNQNGARIDGAGGAGAWAGNGFISMNNATQWPNTPNAPHPVFTHEILHVYEQYQRDIYGFYNGLEGLHGAEEQGYLETSPIGELYWLGWYKDFMRNTVGENHTARLGIQPGVIPAEQDLFIGTFETTRYGLGFLH